MSFTILDTPGPESRPRRYVELPVWSVDYFAFSLWVIVTFVQFPGDQFVLYPLALYYAYSAVRSQRRILALLGRAWPIMLFPLWCVLSVLWAVEPIEALKYSIYMLLTMLICFQVAVTLSPRQVLYAVMLAASCIILYNLWAIYGPNGLPRGIFPQKNTMGKNMVVAFTVTAAVALDGASRPQLRLFALIVAGLAAFSAVISESATAVLLVIGSGGVLITLKLLLHGGLLRPTRLALFCVVLGLGSSMAGLILPQVELTPVQSVLDAFDKDSTLTGRTVLWDYAEDQIEERPYLGVGAGGFWRYQSDPLVRRIYEEFYKGPRDIFNFHSSWYEIAVHQGYVGLSLAGIGTLWAAIWLIRGAAGLGTMPQIYFLTHAMAVYTRFFTEADFLRPFVIFHMLLWIGALLALRQILFQDMERGNPPRF